MKLVVHVDLDSFFVSVERRIDPYLIGRPMLIGGVTDRGVVASCSYEARRFGVRSAMPIKLAKQLCPDAITIRGNTATYTKLSDEIAEIIEEEVPIYERTSVDEFYFDFSGLDKFHSIDKLLKEIRRAIVRETGLPISFGYSVTKTVSKIATGLAKPNNYYRVEQGSEKSFISGFSVKKIPLVGDKVYQTLNNMGIRRIKTVQDSDPRQLVEILGKNGMLLWKKANVLDDHPVVRYNKQKSVSTERTFDKDTIDFRKVRGILIAMTENLAYQLRAGNKLTSCITIKIRYADFNTYSSQKRISYTSADHILIPLATELFDNLYNRRLRIRLIGVRFSHLVGGGFQINLFDDADRIINLHKAMDHIRHRYGDRSVIRAAGMHAHSIGRSNPFSGKKAPLLLANRRM